MKDFQPRSVELQGGFTLDRPVAEAFDLFSPLGEKLWVPGWSPELLHPPGASWERGLLFRTRDERGEVVWIVTELDRAAHRVEYHRLEPDRYIARVAVRCEPIGDDKTKVHTSYTYVGLSETGNAELAGMTPGSYGQKMQQWKRWIEEYFASTARSGNERSGS